MLSLWGVIDRCETGEDFLHADILWGVSTVFGKQEGVVDLPKGEEEDWSWHKKDK